MNSVGEALRRERVRQNLSLEEVARETRISLRFLQAIEADDFAKLPGGVFARSFVRQYGRLVGLDEEELAAEVQRRLQPEPAPAEERPRPHVEAPPIDVPKVADWESASSRSGSSLPALGLVVVVMLVCSLVYAWWQRSRHAATATEQPSEIAQVSAPPPAPAPAAEPAPAPPPETAVSAERSPVEEVPVSTAPVQVRLTAQEPTWISARSDGKFIYSGTLQPNESKGLEAAEEVRLVVGNAGGIAVTLNGKPVPPLGPPGQVRTVQFSSGGVQMVPPKPAAPASEPLF